MKILNKISSTIFQPRKIVLNIILDGVGVSPYSSKENILGDAFKSAHTPILDELMVCSLYRTLYAHGTYVGLPTNNEMGNSEVGHNAIGSGRIFPQGAKLVNQSIEQNSITNNKVWNNLIDFSSKNRSTIHFIGLLSDGYIHSHINHLKHLILQVAKSGIKKIFLHALLDGRDVPPHSSPKYIKEILDYFNTIETKYDTRCEIASVGGRMVVIMDRYEADWKIVEKGWKLIVEGDAERKFTDALTGIKTLKLENEYSDQYLEPFVIVRNGKSIGKVEDGDGVMMFNYRGDRSIEICRAFENPDLTVIKRNKIPKVYFVGMMEYDGDLGIPRNYLVQPPRIDRTMGEYLIKSGLSLFAVSETQKYGHVTYFWNGNRSNKFSKELEEYVEIKSDLDPFEQRPWMKCAEITNTAIKLIQSNKFSFGRINYPNGDMVGHSGDFNATRIAIEAVDLTLGRLLGTVREIGGIAIILSDHGNCDEMLEIDSQGNKKIDKNGNFLVKTSHTLNKVPCFIYDPNKKKEDLEYKWIENDKAGIANITATSLNLMGFEAPSDYEPSLIKWKK